MSRRLVPKSAVPSIIEWIPGHTDNELAQYLTQLTGIQFDRDKAKNFRIREGIPLGKKSRRPRYKYDDQFMEEVRTWIPGHTDKEFANWLEDHTERKWDSRQAKTFRINHGIPLGRAVPGGGRFEKGMIPWSKGRKLGTRGRAAETQFKKGNRPHNAAAVGTKVKKLFSDGSYYWAEKVAEPDQWEFCHRLEWKRHNGEIPDGHVIVFMDQNRDHYQIDNLKCISKSELHFMNRDSLWSDDLELTETALNICRVKSAAYKKRKEKNK